MSRSPNGLHSMAGWTQVSCRAREAIYRGGAGLSPASTLTDPDGTYGRGVIFTEWWWDGPMVELPVLRDYRYSDNRACAHFVASGPEAYTEEDE